MSSKRFTDKFKAELMPCSRHSGHSHAALGLFECSQDLAVGKSGVLHGTSSGQTTRKFHFWRQLMGGGITP